MRVISELSPIVIPCGVGDVMHAFGEQVIVHLSGAQTGGKIALWTEITPPDAGPPPHYHLNEDEFFFVQEGKMAFLQDGQWEQVERGGWPSCHARAFTLSRMSAMRRAKCSLQRFEIFFARCAEEFAKSEGPDMERIVAISAEHGIHYVTP
ncbi:MAG TPA: cupin domain-containing protein [Terrimicrobiaceae bacterium]